MRGWCTVVLFVVGLAACKAGYGPAAPTSQLVRPALADEADALADEERVESELIGVAGAPSCGYAKFVALACKLTRSEEVALLRHRSPIVRGFFARHLARPTWDASEPLRADVAEGLRPLLRDDTVVTFVEGCWVMEMPVGERVVMELCERKDRASRALLAELAASGHPRAQAARECRGF